MMKPYEGDLSIPCKTKEEEVLRQLTKKYNFYLLYEDESKDNPSISFDVFVKMHNWFADHNFIPYYGHFLHYSLPDIEQEINNQIPPEKVEDVYMDMCGTAFLHEDIQFGITATMELDYPELINPEDDEYHFT